MTSIDVEGLPELRRLFRKLGGTEQLKGVRRALKAAAEVVAADARSRVPVRSGRAQASIRAGTSGNFGTVSGGKGSLAYYGWLDFGSRTPRTGNPRRVGPWSGSGRGPDRGRFIYPALDAKADEYVNTLADELIKELDKP